MSYDPAFLNTASASAITYIDGDHGMLRYRGYPIEQLAERAPSSKSRICCSSASCRPSDELRAWSARDHAPHIVHENIKA